MTLMLFPNSCGLINFQNFFHLNSVVINPLSTNPIKWSNTLKPTNCLSVFDHFVGLALKGLSLLPLFYSMLSTGNVTNK